ncbi:MAG: succinate--CoA ligase subunit beta [Firmicutes bacterium]|nr:succinate--CoA ligase subunit beta [Candidatus Fermentithermobacillaceae bacterium]
MKLFEFQAKEIFRRHGIAVPNGTLITRRDEAASLGPPLVLKAQALTGGRGKAGGVVIWDGSEDVVTLVERLLALEIRGEKVRAVLAEEKANILHEYYISITVRGTTATPVLVASEEGGVEIESVAKETPEKIVTIEIDPLTGPKQYQVRALAKGMGVSDTRDLQKVVDGLWSVFTACDATLVEVNPLVATPEGFVALDGKMVLDDKAAFRRGELLSELKAEQTKRLDVSLEEVRSDTITYVPLDGTVGLISDGAGTGMLTIDLIRDEGGVAADFCEMGGFTSPQVIYDAMSMVLADEKVRSLLVVLIGGVNRMDEMAEGIIRYYEEHKPDIPIFVRMCGTMEEVGIEMMRQAGFSTYDDLLTAVRAAVTRAAGGSDD